MRNLIKMELYKLRTSKLFIIFLAVLAAANVIITVASTLLMNALAQGAALPKMQLSAAFTNPFSLGILTMLIYISAVSFLYLDFSDGYIKNIAGQVPNRGNIVIAKFITVAVHNLIFFLAATLGNLLGGVIIGMVADTENLGAAILTFGVKWLLSLAICAILMFFAVGLRSKVIALILGVMFALNALSLLYMGVDALIANVFKTTDFSLGNYMPDSLFGAVNAVENSLVANGIIVAVVFIAAFYILTYLSFKKKDIK